MVHPRRSRRETRSAATLTASSGQGPCASGGSVRGYGTGRDPEAVVGAREAFDQDGDGGAAVGQGRTPDAPSAVRAPRVNKRILRR